MPRSLVSKPRRQFLQAATAAVAFGSFAISKSRAATPSAQVDDIRTISHLTHRYHGWPTLARRRNGELLLSYSGGRESHICPFGRVEIMRSRDSGQTWSWPRVLLDTAIDDRDSGVLETARGTLLVTTFTSLAYEPQLNAAVQAAESGKPTWPAKRLERWQAAHNRLSAEQRRGQLGVWMLRSEDGGVSWSAPYDSLVNSPHGPVQLADGRLLYVGKDLWREGNRVGVCESTDDGRTWSWLAELTPRPGDTIANYHELHAVEVGDGKLILHVRNHNSQNAGETLQCESADGGRSWSQPHPIGVWGLPSHLLRLRDGRLLMSYGYRRPHYGNQARLSEDQGQSWSEPITISADGPSGDLGYPSTVELDDGALVTVWYENLRESPFAVLRQARWGLKA